MTEIFVQPLTLENAKLICNAYQYMTGNVISETPSHREVIEQIALAPHDSFNKWFFFNYYMESRDADKALVFYKYPFYDVIAIIRCVDPSGEINYTYRPLNDILKTHPDKLSQKDSVRKSL